MFSFMDTHISRGERLVCNGKRMGIDSKLHKTYFRGDVRITLQDNGMFEMLVQMIHIFGHSIDTNCL